MENTIPQEYASDFIRGGRATVGFHSLKTGNTFWFNVKRHGKAPVWNVYMHWDVNEEDRFIGIIKLVLGTDDCYEYYPPGTDNTNSWSPLKKEYSAAFNYSWEAIKRQQVPKE